MTPNVTIQTEVTVRPKKWALKLIRRLVGLGDGCYLILLNNYPEETTWKVIGPVASIKEEKP
ncbi:MAG: hypothetical protein ABIH46_08400 [Chloroflexota bacterium]